MIARDEAIGQYQQGEISLGLAARLAEISKEEMMEEFGRRGISVIDYDPADLDDELHIFVDEQRSLGEA